MLNLTVISIFMESYQVEKVSMEQPLEIRCHFNGKAHLNDQSKPLKKLCSLFVKQLDFWKKM